MGKKRETVRRSVAKVKRAIRQIKGPNLLPNEHHGLLWTPESGFERSNFMGPGTQIITRLQRGDKGKTPVDEISRLHDIEYTLASGAARTEEEQLSMARAADQRMINSSWDAYRSGRESLFHTVEGAGLIKAKTLLEDWGILNPRKFLSPRAFKYKLDAEQRDATEYELLLRARSAMLREGPTADPHEVARVDQGQSLFSVKP